MIMLNLTLIFSRKNCVRTLIIFPGGIFLYNNVGANKTKLLSH